MKVSKWKVLSIAGALVLSYVVASDAAQIKVDEDTFADFGFWTKVMYRNIDERNNVIDYNRNVIDVIDARFTIEGQINKVVQFYGEAVSTSAYDVSDGSATRDTDFKLAEGGVNLIAAPELQLRIGKIRIPFTRMQLADEYARINPIEPLNDPQDIVTGILGHTGIVYEPYTDSILDDASIAGADIYAPNLLRFADGGAVLHGDIAEGMLRYNIGVFNQGTDDQPFNSICWAARVEFTPTMAGFSPETTSTPKGWLKDTYLGKKGDILTIGVGYFSQDVDPDLSGNTYKELDVDGYTVDVFLEKKFQPAILNVEAAYINLNESHLEPSLIGGTFTTNSTSSKGDTYFWYAQGQLLYDGVIGIGKPAIFAKYEYGELDATGGDLEWSAWGAGINYYIEGNAARLSAGFTNVSYDELAENYLDTNNMEDNITDWYIQAQIMF